MWLSWSVFISSFIGIKQMRIFVGKDASPLQVTPLLSPLYPWVERSNHGKSASLKDASVTTDQAGSRTHILLSTELESDRSV